MSSGFTKLGTQLIAAIAWLHMFSCHGEFALKNNDVVVFLGDSITAARTYGKVVENYTLLRFPDRKVQFVNAGKGGDTAAGALTRLKEDVFAHRATVLIVAYGINDIGWGGKADAEHKKTYLDAVREIVQRCKERNVRVFLCSAAITAADPRKSENDFLQSMCDEGMAIARAMGEHSIDVQRTMREVQKRIWEANERESDPKEKTSLHASDGIHLNELGQLAMAYAILKGLGAPADISSVSIDATIPEKPQLMEANGCKVSRIRGSSQTLEFERLDQGLPINFGLLGALNFRFIPIPEELNRYMLQIKNLAPGKYEIAVNGRSLGSVGTERLASGLNVSSMTADPWLPGGDWEAQAAILKMLTDAEHELLSGTIWASRFLSESPNLAQIKKQSASSLAKLQELQRTVAQPVPYRFVIRRIE